MSNSDSEFIDILIADDHPIYRSGLRALLETMQPLRVIGEASSGTEALTMAHELRPQLVLMDVNLPDLTGIEATKTLANKHPAIGVIIVTMLDDKDAFLSAIRAGARGFLLKGASSEEVGHAIKVVHFGGLAFDSRSSRWVIDHLTKPPTESRPFPELTDREREILELIADGLGNAAIARQLGLSVKTVRNYVSRIFARLRVVDRTEAAVQARRAGLGH
jgi:DNA-binding NarL/FixJ family response regulator